MENEVEESTPAVAGSGDVEKENEKKKKKKKKPAAKEKPEEKKESKKGPRYVYIIHVSQIKVDKEQTNLIKV